MKKEKRKCNAFVEKNSARCENHIFGGTKYCFSHYPKKEPIVLSLSLALLTLIFTIIFNVPISNALSKIPFLWDWVDNQEPIISEIIPNIEKSKELDKNNKLFKIICFDKGSGLNLSKCSVNIYDKNDSKHKPIAGKFNKSNRELSFDLDVNLKNGEYKLEVYLADKAGNHNDLNFPFIVREKEDLELTGIYAMYEESRVKEIFKSSVQEFKEFSQPGDFYVYYLKFANKDNNVVLKDLFFNLDTFGGVIYSWKIIQDRNADGVELMLPWGQELPIHKSRIFMDSGVLRIDKIGIEGFVTIAILVDCKLLSGGIAPHVIELWGKYFSDGYGVSKMRKFEDRTITINKGDLYF